MQAKWLDTDHATLIKDGYHLVERMGTVKTYVKQTKDTYRELQLLPDGTAKFRMRGQFPGIEMATRVWEFNYPSWREAAERISL